jgi:hypothetical protein
MIIRFSLMCAMAAAAISSGCTSLLEKAPESDADLFIHTVLASDQAKAYNPPSTPTSTGSDRPSAFDQFVARFFMIDTVDSFTGATTDVNGHRLASADFVMLLLR